MREVKCIENTIRGDRQLERNITWDVRVHGMVLRDGSKHLVNLQTILFLNQNHDRKNETINLNTCSKRVVVVIATTKNENKMLKLLWRTQGQFDGTIGCA